MKQTTTLIAFVAMAAFATTAFGQAGKGGPGSKGPGQRGNQAGQRNADPAQMVGRMLERHDANGDGALDSQELAAALTAMQGQRRNAARGGASARGQRGQGNAQKQTGNQKSRDRKNANNAAGGTKGKGNANRNAKNNKDGNAKNSNDDGQRRGRARSKENRGKDGKNGDGNTGGKRPNRPDRKDG